MSNYVTSGDCIVCGARIGEPCTHINEIAPDSELVLEGYELPHHAGDPRPSPHFYRGTEPIERPFVAVKDEPPYYA